MIVKHGVDHRLSIDDREAEIARLAPLLVGEYVYLQTCNRVELYSGDGACDAEIVRHLFRVVSGIESKMLGEAHIQGQVKRAYLEAREKGHISSGLHRLFQTALRCGKRVRSETAISTGAVSHSHAAVLAIQNWSCSEHSIPVLIIGVTELTRKVVTFLQHKPGYHITVANRSVEKIELLFGTTVTALDLAEVEAVLNQFPIVVSATGSPHVLIKEQWVDVAQDHLFIDLAVPRDIDPAIGNLPNSTIETVDDLEKLVEHSIQKRGNEVVEAEQIIAEECQNYFDEIEKGKRYAQK